MQRIMQNNAAVFRTQETLEEGIPFPKSYNALTPFCPFWVHKVALLLTPSTEDLIFQPITLSYIDFP